MLNTRNEWEGAPWEVGSRKVTLSGCRASGQETDYSSAKAQRLRHLENPKLDVFSQRIKGEKFTTPSLQFGLLRGDCLSPCLFRAAGEGREGLEALCVSEQKL